MNENQPKIRFSEQEFLIWMIFLEVELYHHGFTTIHPNYNERACLVWALMPQAVL